MFQIHKEMNPDYHMYLYLEVLLSLYVGLTPECQEIKIREYCETSVDR